MLCSTFLIGSSWQGDREDRIRIRQQAERMRKRAEAQQAADELALMPRRMAGEGASEAEICAALERQRVSKPKCLSCLLHAVHSWCRTLAEVAGICAARQC